MMTIKLLMVCNNGCSSSVAAENLQKQIDHASLPYEVIVHSKAFYLTFPFHLEPYDIILLCPQTYHELLMLEKDKLPDIPIYMIPPKIFVQMSYSVLLQDIEDILLLYQSTPQNPIHFPGEEHYMSNRRSISYRDFIKQKV